MFTINIHIKMMLYKKFQLNKLKLNEMEWQSSNTFNAVTIQVLTCAEHRGHHQAKSKWHRASSLRISPNKNKSHKDLSASTSLVPLSGHVVLVWDQRRINSTLPIRKTISQNAHSALFHTNQRTHLRRKETQHARIKVLERSLVGFRTDLPCHVFWIKHTQAFFYIVYMARNMFRWNCIPFEHAIYRRRCGTPILVSYVWWKYTRDCAR